MLAAKADIRPAAAAVVERLGQVVRVPKEATDAVEDFLTGLWDSSGVDAVAVLLAQEPDCPTTLALRVFLPLDPENDHASATLRVVTEAEATLSERLLPSLPSGMRIVSTAKRSLTELEPELQQRWQASKTLRLLSFLPIGRA